MSENETNFVSVRFIVTNKMNWDPLIESKMRRKTAEGVILYFTMLSPVMKANSGLIYTSEFSPQLLV